jgi:hypothetical protein
VLRKTLCGLLKLKAYSTASLEPRKADGGIVLAQAATVFYDTLERSYPNFPDVKAVKLSEKELVRRICSSFDHFLFPISWTCEIRIQLISLLPLFPLIPLSILELLARHSRSHGCIPFNREREHVDPSSLQVTSLRLLTLDLKSPPSVCLQSLRTSFNT